MHYHNRFRSNLEIRCNGCNTRAKVSPRDRFQLLQGTKEYFGWIRTEFNEIFCPDCSKIIKDGVDRMHFQILTSNGFSDKKLLTDSLKPLKKAGNTFVTDSISIIMKEVVEELNLPVVVKKAEADTVLFFHHIEEDVQHLVENVKVQVHKFVSQEPKVLNQFEAHLQTLIHTGEPAQSVTLEHVVADGQMHTAEALPVSDEQKVSGEQEVSTSENTESSGETSQAESTQTETS